MKEIPLTQGKVAIVDDDDWETLSRFKWHATQDGKHHYAAHRLYVNGQSIQIVKMHRLILGAAKSEIVDHVNRDGLDNRRCNLRITDRAGNAANSVPHCDSKSGIKGVARHLNKWIAMFRGKYLGLFETAELAVEAYNKAAKEHFGEMHLPSKI